MTRSFFCSIFKEVGKHIKHTISYTTIIRSSAPNFFRAVNIWKDLYYRLTVDLLNSCIKHTGRCRIFFINHECVCWPKKTITEADFMSLWFPHPCRVSILPRLVVLIQYTQEEKLARIMSRSKNRERKAESKLEKLSSRWCMMLCEFGGCFVFKLLHKEKHSAATLYRDVTCVLDITSFYLPNLGLYIFNFIISGSTQRLTAFSWKKWMISKTTTPVTPLRGMELWRLPPSLWGAYGPSASRFEPHHGVGPRLGVAHWKECHSHEKRRATDFLKRWWWLGSWCFFFWIFGKLTKLSNPRTLEVGRWREIFLFEIREKLPVAWWLRPASQADIELAIPRGGQHKGFRWGSQDIPFREGSLVWSFSESFFENAEGIQGWWKETDMYITYMHVYIIYIYTYNHIHIYTYICDLPRKIGLRWYWVANMGIRASSLRANGRTKTPPLFRIADFSSQFQFPTNDGFISGWKTFDIFSHMD